MRILLHFLTPRRILALGKGLTLLGKTLMAGGKLVKVGLILACVALGVITVAIFLPGWQDFNRELRYIKTEIGRTEGREQAHWKKKKRRLWLSLLPFFRY